VKGLTRNAQRKGGKKVSLQKESGEGGPGRRPRRGKKNNWERERRAGKKKKPPIVVPKVFRRVIGEKHTLPGRKNKSKRNLKKRKKMAEKVRRRGNSGRPEAIVPTDDPAFEKKLTGKGTRGRTEKGGCEEGGGKDSIGKSPKKIKANKGGEEINNKREKIEGVLVKGAMIYRGKE